MKRKLIIGILCLTLILIIPNNFFVKADDDCYEPNNTIEDAAKIERDIYYNCYMASEDSVDYYKVLCLSNREETFTFTTQNNLLKFELLDVNGNKIPIIKRSSVKWSSAQAYNYKVNIQETQYIYIKVSPRIEDKVISGTDGIYYFQFGEPFWLSGDYAYDLPTLYFNAYGETGIKLLDLTNINVPDTAIVEKLSISNIRGSIGINLRSQIKLNSSSEWFIIDGIKAVYLRNFRFNVKNLWSFKCERTSNNIPNIINASLFIRYKYEYGTN